MHDFFAELDGNTADEVPMSQREILKPPLPWPGGKSGLATKVVEYLPQGTRYIEPFGGSAAVLLARHPVKLEVYNDRYGAVVDFYRCLRDEESMRRLKDLLELTVYSREDFVWCKETWQHTEDMVDRAARWYYMMNYSFGGLGRNWGRAVGISGNMAGKVRNKIKKFPQIHERFKKVQIENLDWEQCFDDYDHPDSVFYCDPPYLETSAGVYKAGELSEERHQELLNRIFDCQGFVAISSYANRLYDSYDWDDVVEWEKYVSMQSLNTAEGSGKAGRQHAEERGYRTETLYIKEAR